MSYRRVSAIVVFACTLIIALGFVLWGQDYMTDTRRIRSRMEMEKIAAILSSDELFLWIHNDGTATLIAPGKVCGAAPFSIARRDIEATSMQFYGWIIERLRENEIDLFLSSVRRIYIYFDVEVPEETRQLIRGCFDYRTTEVGCVCNPDTGACCSSAIEEWEIHGPQEGQKQIEEIHNLVRSEIFAHVIIVTDGAAAFQPFLSWLGTVVPNGKLHWVNLQYEGHTPVLGNVGWQATNEDVVVLVVALERPLHSLGQEAAGMITSLLSLAGAAKLVVWLEFTSPNTVGGQSLQVNNLAPSSIEAVAFPVNNLPLAAVEGLLRELLGAQTVADVAEVLTGWGCIIIFLK